MKKQLLLFVMILLPIVASADMAVDGIYTIDGIKYNLSGTSAVVVSGDYKYAGVTIPSTVTYKNKNYTVTAIGSKAFMECTTLKYAYIPSSVTSIGEHAFDDCTGLTSIVIPNAVKSIGNWAFSGCNGLTSIEIPNAVTSIGDRTFMGCSGLTSISVADDNKVYDSREGCNAIIETATNTLISGCQNTVIPSSVTSIGDFAFYGCSGLTSVTIPNSVTSIGGSAFSGCSGLTSINILDGVTSIGASAFYGCSGLISVNIPDGVTSIGEYNQEIKGETNVEIVSVIA